MRLSPRLSHLVRGAALLFGCAILVVSLPFAFLAGAAPADAVPAWSPLLVVPAIAALLASGFLTVGIAGPRLADSRLRRAVAGLLLALPFGAGVALLLAPGHPETRPFGMIFATPAALLFLCAVWPLRLRDMQSDPSTR